MSKSIKKLIAYLCTIALVVSSITVYNTKAVIADDEDEYAGLTFVSMSTTGQGEAPVSDSDGKKVPMAYAVLEDESQGDIVNAVTINIYNGEWFQATWGAGIYINSVLNINGTDIVNGGPNTAAVADALAQVQTFGYFHMGYNTVKVTNEAGDQWVTFIVRAGTYGEEGEEEDTTVPEVTTSALDNYTWSALEYSTLSGYQDENTISTNYKANAKYLEYGTTPPGLGGEKANGNGINFVSGATGQSILLFLNGTEKERSIGWTGVNWTVSYNDLADQEYNDITIAFLTNDNEIIEYRYIIWVSNGDAPVETTTPSEEISTPEEESSTPTEETSTAPEVEAEWVYVAYSKNIMYKTDDSDKIATPPQLEGDGKIFVAYKQVALRPEDSLFTSVTMNGEPMEQGFVGAGVKFSPSIFEERDVEYTLVVEDYNGVSVTIVFKKVEEEETTTAPEVVTPDPGFDDTGYSTDPGVWKLKVDNNDGSSAKHKNQDKLNDYYVHVYNGTGDGSGDVNSIHASTEFPMEFAEGYVYDYVITVELLETNAVGYVATGINEETMLVTTVESGINYLEGSFTATEKTHDIILALGHVENSKNTYHITNVSVKEHVSTDEPLEGKIWERWTHDKTNWTELSKNPSAYRLPDQTIGGNWYDIQTAINNVLLEAGKIYKCTFTLLAPFEGKAFRVDQNLRTNAPIDEGQSVTLGKWEPVNGDEFGEEYSTYYKYSYEAIYTESSEPRFRNFRISLGYFADGTMSATGAGDNTEYYQSGKPYTFAIRDFQLTVMEAQNEKVEGDILIEGFQIAVGTVTTTQGATAGSKFNGGVRTVYSIPHELDGKNVTGYTKGIIYANADAVSKDEVDLKHLSSNVISTVATSAGVLSENYLAEKPYSATYYGMIMAMDIEKLTSKAINKKIYVRAYVRSGDTYYYSEVKEYTMHDIAEYLYENQLMSEEGHNKLHTCILGKCEEHSHLPIDYNKNDYGMFVSKEEDE